MTSGPLERLRRIAARAEEDAGAALAARLGAEADARRGAALAATAWAEAARAREDAERLDVDVRASGALLALASRHAGRLRDREAAQRGRCAGVRAAADDAGAEVEAARVALAALRGKRERVEARLAAEQLARRVSRERAQDEAAAEESCSADRVGRPTGAGDVALG